MKFNKTRGINLGIPFIVFAVGYFACIFIGQYTQKYGLAFFVYFGGAVVALILRSFLTSNFK